MNINTTSFQSTVRFSEPAAALEQSVSQQNSQAAIETKRPVENSEATTDTRKYSGSEDLGQNLDIQV